MTQPRNLLMNESSNIKQKYEEMTRFKMANDAKLLNEAKYLVEDKLKTSGPQELIMINVNDSKFLLSLK